MHTERTSLIRSTLAVMLSALLATTLMVPPIAWADPNPAEGQPAECQPTSGNDLQSAQTSEEGAAGTEAPEGDDPSANGRQQSGPSQKADGGQGDVGISAFSLPSSAKAADVAQVGDTGYTSLADAIASAEAGGTVTLLADITIDQTLVIDKSLTLDGAGKTITATGLNPVIELDTTGEVAISKLTVTGAKRGLALYPGAHVTLTGCTLNVSERGIDSQKNIPYENMSIILNNTAINNSRVSNYDTETTGEEYSRGISLWNSKNSVVKIQNGSSINGFAYCVNVSGGESAESGVCDTEGLKVEVVDSTLRGWAGLNVWGALAEYSIIRSTVKGINPQGEGGYGFAALVFNDDVYDRFAQLHAANNILNITDSTITNHQSSTPTEDLLRIDCGITALNLSGVVNFVDTTGNVEGALDLEEMSDPITFLQKQVHRAGGTTVNCTTVNGASLAFAPDYLAYYYRDDRKGGFKGTSRTDFADIVTSNGYTFRAGEYIDLLADVNLAENITANLEEGTGTFTLNRKGHAVTGGTITLPQGVSVKTDAPNEGLFVAAAGSVLLETVEGGVYTYSAYPEGVAAVFNPDGSVKGTYASLKEAVAAVGTTSFDTGAAPETATVIKLLKDTNDGIDIGTSGRLLQNIVLDLDGHTLTLGPAVGSAGTETNGLRVLSYSKVEIKNGVVTSSDILNSANTYVKFVLVNYGTMKLDNVKVVPGSKAMLSINNRGALTLAGATEVETAPTGFKWAITNDVYDAHYPDFDASLTVQDDSVRVGVVSVERYATDRRGNNGSVVLNIGAGTFEGIVDDGEDAVGFESNITGGTFSSNVEAYLAQGYYQHPSTGAVLPMPAVDPDLDIAVDAPAIVPGVPGATITDEAKQAAVDMASRVLDAVSQGAEPPAGVTKEEADRIREVVGSDPAHKITAVVSVSVERRSPEDVADDAFLIDGALGDDQGVAVYFDIKVSLIVRNEATGRSTAAALTSLDRPLVFEVHVPPDSIAGRAVRIACVHGGVLRWIDPVSVDRAQGVILVRAGEFSTYAVVASSTVEVAFEPNGGSAVPTQTVPFGGKASKPADPVRAGYDFAGWYADNALAQPWDFDAPVEAYLVLYAKWAPAPGGPAASASGKPAAAPGPGGPLASTGDAALPAAGLLALCALAAAAAAVRASRRRRG